MSIAHIQTKGGQSSGAVSSLSVTLDSSSTNGNLLVVSVVAFNTVLDAVPTISVTDSKGNSYTEFVTIDDGQGRRISIFYAKNITGGASHQITSTPDNTIHMMMCATEYSGASTTSPANGSSSATGTSTTPNAGSVSSQSDGMIVGLMTFGGSTTTITPGSGWTERFERESGTSQAVGSIEDKAGSTDDPDWTLAASREWWAVGASFVVGGAGSGLPVSVSETLGISDGPVLRRVLARRDIAENVGLTDSVAWLRSILRVVAEDLHIYDGRLFDGSLRFKVNYFREIIEDLVLTDFDAASGTPLVFTIVNGKRIVTDNLGLQDAVARLANAKRVISENLALADTVLTGLALAKIIRVIETLGVSDVSIYEIIRLVCEELQTTPEFSEEFVFRPPECADER